jgi:hypothetical protein
MTCAGFPHSEISGSRLVCNSPELFAACHVLHRLLTPRHPPCALSSLSERQGAWLGYSMRCNTLFEMSKNNRTCADRRRLHRGGVTNKLKTILGFGA